MGEEINSIIDVLPKEDGEIIDKQIADATRRVAQEREKLLALCFYRGYDGVDILPKQDVLTDPTDFALGFEHEAWQDEPPQRERFEACQRYDFRMLSTHQKRRLCGVLGIRLEDIPHDG